MKKLLLVLSGVCFSSAVLANELPELPQTTNTEYEVVGNVTLNNVHYQKVVKADTRIRAFSSMRSMAADAAPVREPGLFSGDIIKKGMIDFPQLISGSFFISVNEGQSLADVASAHNMKLTYSSGNLGVLKAADNVELTGLLALLQSDKRIATVNVEKIANKMQPM